MEKNKNSWYGNDDLKRDVLSKMRHHYKVADFIDLEISGQKFNIYGWRENHGINYALCSELLGLDEGLLKLGFNLIDGFPEDKKSIQEVIKYRIQVLENIPVGVNISNVCKDFICWRLENIELGSVDIQTKNQIIDLITDVAICLYSSAEEMKIVEEKVIARHNEILEKIPQQYKQFGKVDIELYYEKRALEIALAACKIFTDTSSAENVADKYIDGCINTTEKEEEEEEMKNIFMDILSNLC